MPDDAALDARMERVEQLVHALDRCPDPVVRDQVKELVATVMDFHGEALARMLEILQSHAGSGADALRAMAEDIVVANVLLLHDLHPQDVTARVAAALEEVRPALKAHQGDVEVLAIGDGVVRLRLQGTCNGCASSTTTFRTLIETAIQHRAPEIHSIRVEGLSVA